MTDDTAATPPRSTPGATTESDWTDQVTDLVVHLVDAVRSRTTGPILKIARVVVYGLVALTALIVIAVLTMLLIGRSLALLPFDLWIAYLGAGVLMVLIGMGLWTLRRAKA
jgi:hypothetical protein